MTDNKQRGTDWRKYFLKIREILNNWDPIGVADSVEDEYDGMNFKVLSVLMNNHDKKEVREVLADHARNYMVLDVDDATLDRVSEEILKLRDGKQHR